MSSPLLLLPGRVRDLGGFRVHRALPAMQRRRVGPFVFWDHMGPATLAPGDGMDVRPHPHVNLATVTYLFAGEIVHKDSLGSDQAIRPGDVNWMSAGRGIVHSERTGPELRKSGSAVHGIQSWVALPTELEESAPTFEHVGGAALPETGQPGVRLRVVAGTAFGLTSPVRVLAPLFYVAARLDAGAELALPREYAERAAYVVEGAVACDGERIEAMTMAIAEGTRPRRFARSRARASCCSAARRWASATSGGTSSPAPPSGSSERSANGASATSACSRRSPGTAPSSSRSRREHDRMIDPRAAPYSTIPELLAWRAREGGDRAWLRYEGDSYSARDVLAQSERYATGLAERGVVPGDRVAIAIGNEPSHLFAWFGANLLGAIACPVHVGSKPAELARHLGHTTPRAIVASGELRALAGAALDALGLDGAPPPAVTSPEDLARAGAAFPRAEVGGDDVAVLLGTSGTTGAPKGVLQTHRTYALTAEAFPAWLGLDARDRLLAFLPLSHVNAQAYSTMGALGCGAELLLLPKFSAGRFLADARRLGATQLNAVGAIVHILLKTEPRPDDRDNPLRLAYTALALPEAQHRAFEERFGLSMRVGYGLSETTFGTIWPRDHAPRYGTMGTLRQHPRLGAINEARVVREDGADALEGATGELLLRNPAMRRADWTDPTQTEAALDGGWLHTGDLVQREPEGFFRFVSRKKEVLRRRGENVAAAEIEAVLLAHPAVREAAAVGVPADLGEDEIVAFVALVEGASVEPDVLRAFVRERLADFKVPSRIELRAELPHTATNRDAKHLLR